MSVAAVDTGIWIGALDIPLHGRMMRHTVLDDAQRYDYPEEVGGCWAYAKCGDPAYCYPRVTSAVTRLPECWRCTPPESAGGGVSGIHPAVDDAHRPHPE